MTDSSQPVLRFIEAKDSKENLQATKWIKLPILIDGEEMKALLDVLGDFWIFPVGSVTKRSAGTISKETFLQVYLDYINAIKSGKLPEERLYRPVFSSIFTTSTDPLYAIPVGNDQQLIKIIKPVVQLQIHQLDYSPIDHKFRSMILGQDTVLWGIQFSYPQLTQNENLEIINVTESPDFPNTHLFRELQRWIRHNTTPTPFVVDDKKINVPVRLGKACTSWINNHPQLIKKGIKVAS